MPTDPAFLESLVVSPISRSIDLSRFECNEAIDWYLRTVACDHHERRITSVSCFLQGDDLAGYVTTSMTEVAIDESPLRAFYNVAEIIFRKGQGHRKRFPGLLIGMLGVCKRHVRRGLGEHMVKYAIGQAGSHSVGCRFVQVDSDATVEAQGLYTKMRFTAPSGQKRNDNVRMLYDLGAR